MKGNNNCDGQRGHCSVQHVLPGTGPISFSSLCCDSPSGSQPGAEAVLHKHGFEERKSVMLCPQGLLPSVQSHSTAAASLHFTSGERQHCAMR